MPQKYRFLVVFQKKKKIEGWYLTKKYTPAAEQAPENQSWMVTGW